VLLAQALDSQPHAGYFGLEWKHVHFVLECWHVHWHPHQLHWKLSTAAKYHLALFGSLLILSEFWQSLRGRQMANARVEMKLMLQGSDSATHEELPLEELPDERLQLDAVCLPVLRIWMKALVTLVVWRVISPMIAV